MGRAELIVESEDPVRLNGGEAIAELTRPRLNNAAAAMIISRFLPFVFMLQIDSYCNFNAHFPALHRLCLAGKAPTPAIDMGLNLFVSNMRAAVLGVCALEHL